MNPACKDIATLLSDESALGLVLNTNLFYSRMPDPPDDCVTVYDNPGRPPMLTNKKETSDYYYSSVSVWVRNTDYDTAWTLLNDIMVFLHGSGNFELGTTFYSVIKALGNPQLLHWDENDRAVLIVNFEVQRRNI